MPRLHLTHLLVLLLLLGAAGCDQDPDHGEPITDTLTPDTRQTDTAPPDTSLTDTTPADTAPPVIWEDYQTCDPVLGEALYQTHIAPLMDAAHRSSCNNCHLSGVELGNLARETPCQTMACMKERELVNFEAPAESTVLGWILRGEPDSALITDAVVQREHDAFHLWIDYHARCNDQLCEPQTEPCAGAAPPVEPEASAAVLLPGCDKAALTQAFSQKVMVWADRCAHCHSTAEPPPPGVDLPQWIAVGDDDDAAERSMLNLLALGAVDVEAPILSRLLNKPLAELAGGMPHGGGDKIESRDEQTFIDFYDWTLLYQSCYDADLLPEDMTP